jgi:aldehyde:ferredoxin oxidoreductase
MCVGTILRGFGEDGPFSHGGVFDWKLGTRGGMEANVLCNRYGINQWDLIIGMVPWLEACQNAGLISEINGREMNWQSSTFWAEFLHAIAYREGIGDALAEGGWRAAQILHLGEELVRRYYTGWGYAGHWDGHGSWSNYLVFPYWLVSALQWATDTRDPIPSGHGYVQNVMNYGPLRGRRPITWDHMRGIAARIYGDPDAVDPYSGYKAKAYPAFYHTKRSVMKDCLPADDFRFPMIYHPNSPDRFFRVDGIDGPSVEYHLFKAGTGTEWAEEEFERAAERVYTLERAVAVRHWGRDRSMDEMVLPSYEYLENWANPLLGERYALDREQFEPVMDDYYRYQGWDAETGWPTRERLAELGIEDVYEPMVAGARRAKVDLPEPPRAEPVPLIHG